MKYKPVTVTSQNLQHLDDVIRGFVLWISVARDERLPTTTTIPTFTNHYHYTNGYQPLPLYQRLPTTTTIPTVTNHYHYRNGYQPLPLYQRLPTNTTIPTATNHYYYTNGYQPLPLYQRLPTTTTIPTATNQYHYTNGYQPLPLYQRYTSKRVEKIRRKVQNSPLAGKWQKISFPPPPASDFLLQTTSTLMSVRTLCL